MEVGIHINICVLFGMVIIWFLIEISVLDFINT